MLESLFITIVYDEETVEPYYSILCTDQDDNAIELLTDNVFNTYEEAQVELENILNKIKGGK